MGRSKGRPQLAPGEALSEVISVKVSPETRAFYEKFAALLHADDVTPALIVRSVLDRFRYEVEEQAEDRWLTSLNAQFSRRDE